jgi:hypothetical protein
MIQCAGISLAIKLTKTGTGAGLGSFSIDQVLQLSATIFTTLSILGKYAPGILASTKQGIGFHTGLNMIGGSSDGSCHCVNPYSTEQRKLCKALKKSGFKPGWTLKDIKRMKKTRNGRQALRRLDKRIRQRTKMKFLTHNNIASCYPKYKAGKKRKPRTRKRRPKAALHCQWESLRKEIHKVVRDSDPVTENYLKARAELELRTLINIFQEKTNKEWQRFYRENRASEPRGFHIKGTTHYIPWKLLRKWSVCFGQGSSLSSTSS